MGPVRALVKWLDANELLAAIGAATLIVSVASYIVDRAVKAPLGLALLFAAGVFLLSVAVLRPVFHTVLAPYHRAKLAREREGAEVALEIRHAENSATAEERSHAQDIHRALVLLGSELKSSRERIAHARQWNQFWVGALPISAWEQYGDLISREPSLTAASRKAAYAYAEVARVAPHVREGEPLTNAGKAARVAELHQAIADAHDEVNRAIEARVKAGASGA